MKGYEGLTFLFAVNDMTDTAVITATAQGATQSDGSDVADLAVSATYTATSATTGDAKLMAVEAFRLLQRYVRLKVERGTADSSLDVIVP